MPQPDVQPSRLAATALLAFSPLLLPGVAAATSIDLVELCVDDTGFHFAVEVTESEAEIILRIAADGEPFGGDTERIAVNFDGASGAITRQEPIAQPVGSPPFDRWLDGLIADWAITPATGASDWRFAGVVPHGTEPFDPGDTAWGVAVRSTDTVYVQTVAVSACGSGVTPIQVPFTTNPPRLDGEIDLGEWASGALHPLAGGELRLLHDETRLYLLFDLLDDGTDDPAWNGGFDQVWVHFDVDEDGAVTFDLDRRYREESGTGNWRYETYCDGCLFGFNPAQPATFSARALGFGCFAADGSMTAAGCAPHRLWELAVDLEEIAARVDGSARLGYLVQTDSSTVQNLPADLDDLASYIPLELAGPTADGDPGEPAVQTGLEVTQGVQLDDNSLDLVAGRGTVVRAFLTHTAAGERAGALVSVKGVRAGVDLPGSPLMAFAEAALVGDTSFDTRRSDPATSVEWVLPASWAAGDVSFQLELRRPWALSATSSSPIPVSFVETVTPTYWVVPVDIGTPSWPSAPTAAFMDTAEEATREVFPLADIDFVRRPTFMSGPTDSPTLKADLNEMAGQAVLAWTLGLLFTGEAPFALPDQIIGMTSTGLCSDPPGCSKNAAGSSDPVWGDGSGVVCWGGPTATSGDYVMAHEVNHNLDTDPSGTWGRHVPTSPSSPHSCQNPTGADPSWPYADEEIDDWGFRTRLPVDGSAGDVVVEDTTPDLMSYCRDADGPVKWVSPYRWQAQLDDVFAVGAARVRAVTRQDVQDTLYVSGTVLAAGGGVLDPVLLQPGIPQPLGASGSHAVVVRDCTDAVLAEHRFTPNFEDVEGGVADHTGFSRRLAAPAGACSVALLEETEILAERVLTPNPPVVTVLAPNGGELWLAAELIEWQVEDGDGDEVTSTVLYSPDDGATWLPVAGGLTGTAYAVDAGTLPGSATARIRVIATDGFNTAFDDSDDPFAVVLKAPETVILEPGLLPALPAGAPIELRGVARDAGGVRLPEEQLEWELDGELLAIGGETTIWLAPGEHVLSLLAKPPEGPFGEATLHLTAAPGLIFADGFDADALGRWSAAQE